MAKVLCYDIDGVVTVESDTHHEDLAGSYIYRSPNLRVREQMFRAFTQGWTVVLFTGRREVQRRLTEDWLAQHGFHYHFLFMGKPYFTYIVDDRARTLDEIDAALNEEIGKLELVRRRGGKRKVVAKVTVGDSSQKAKAAGEAPQKPNPTPTQNHAEPAVSSHRDDAVAYMRGGCVTEKLTESPADFVHVPPGPVGSPKWSSSPAHENVAFQTSWLDAMAKAIHDCSIRILDSCGIHIPGLWDRVRQLDKGQQRIMFLTEVTVWFRDQVKKRVEELEVKRRDEESRKCADQTRKAQAGQPPHGELRCRPLEDEGG